MQTFKIITVAAARPNFVKTAAIANAFARYPEVDLILVNTGQHYDREMSRLFIDELQLPGPRYSLGIGSGTPADQLARTMVGFEKVLLEVKPDLVIVVGDVNATIACGLVTVQHNTPLAHVEAGLRSFDRTMPEETNRVLTDHIADLLFATERSGKKNLLAEGIPREKIFLVGNVMVDTLQRFRLRARRSKILDKISVKARRYGLVTLHRPGNVDEGESLQKLLEALREVQEKVPLIFPIHPRTRKQIQLFGFDHLLASMTNTRVLEPLGYLDFLKLMGNAKFVVTDSGGIQEETTVLRVPCITVRENTERPVTVEMGTNEVVGTRKKKIVEACMKASGGHWRQGQVPPLWDGHAAGRISTIILEKLAGRKQIPTVLRAVPNAPSPGGGSRMRAVRRTH